MANPTRPKPKNHSFCETRPETEKILPAHRGRHMLGREVGVAIGVIRANENERAHHKKMVPDRLGSIQLLQVALRHNQVSKIAGS